MKITQEHLKVMRDSINEYLENNPDTIGRYIAGDIPHADRVGNLQIRFAWDMIEFSLGNKWICDNIYPYADDTHIKTALKYVAPKLPAKQGK